jgi:sortase (surface protein transpeptidase)
MRLVIASILIAVVVAAGALHRPAPPDSATVAVPAAAPPPSEPGPLTPQVHRASAPRRAPQPVRLRIPAIGVDAPLIPLGLDATGALNPPAGFNEAGWWSAGTRPGEPGPAVIAGHIDSKTGPAVFFKVPKLAPGDAVFVRRRDGSQIRFTVERTAHYPKTRFPSAAVYGRTRRPALRLITCSGTFDRATGHYLDNTVVYASA